MVCVLKRFSFLGNDHGCLKKVDIKKARLNLAGFFSVNLLVNYVVVGLRNDGKIRPSRLITLKQTKPNTMMTLTIQSDRLKLPVTSATTPEIIGEMI